MYILYICLKLYIWQNVQLKVNSLSVTDTTELFLSNYAPFNFELNHHDLQMHESKYGLNYNVYIIL